VRKVGTFTRPLPGTRGKSTRTPVAGVLVERFQEADDDSATPELAPVSARCERIRNGRRMIVEPCRVVVLPTGRCEVEEVRVFAVVVRS
jgi:hypothetical protein